MLLIFYVHFRKMHIIIIIRFGRRKLHALRLSNDICLLLRNEQFTYELSFPAYGTLFTCDNVLRTITRVHYCFKRFATSLKHYGTYLHDLDFFYLSNFVLMGWLLLQWIIEYLDKDALILKLLQQSMQLCQPLYLFNAIPRHVKLSIIRVN